MKKPCSLKEQGFFMQHFERKESLTNESERIPLLTTTIMKQVLLLTFVLISGLLNPLKACEDMTFSIDFNGEANIPETVNYILEDGNGWTDGVITIAGESNFPFVLCVQDECFAFTIYTDDVLTGVEAINVETDQGEFYSELYSTDLGYSIEGCIVDSNDCPDEPLYLGSECLTGVFEIGSFVEGEEVAWNFGDGTFESGGHFTTHEYEQPGTYQVCGFYTSPGCEGAEYCGVIEISDCGSPCEIEIEVIEQVDCGAYQVGIFNGNVNQFDWYLDGELYWEGVNYMVVYLEELGEHSLCAVYTNEECGEVETCITLSAEGCVETCTEVQFGLLNLSEDITSVDWSLSGPGIVLAEGTAEYDGFGTEWIDLCIEEGCYYFEVNSAEGLLSEETFSLSMQGISGMVELTGTGSGSEYIGFELCVGPTLIYEEFECPQEISYEINEDCSSIFTLEGTNPDSTVFWYLDDVYVGELGENYEVFIEEPGWHTVCADYSYVGCWDVVCTEVLIEDCAIDCPAEIETYVDPNCFAYFDLIGGDNLGNTIWYLDGEVIAEGPPYYSGFIDEPGWHLVCVEYSGPGCEGMEQCTDVFVDGCGDNCDVSIVANSDGCDGEYYVQGISDATDILWSFDQFEYEAFNSGVTWTFETNGWHLVCAEFYTEECGTMSVCEEVFIQGCNDEDCDAVLAILGTEGCISEIRVQGIPTDVAIGWTFNDVSFVSESNYWFSYDYPENGWYTICANFETEECGDMILCEEVYIEGCGNNECYLDGFLETFGCGEFMLKLYGENEMEQMPEIYLDGEYYGMGWSEEFYLEPGEYEICGMLPATETCDALEFCVDAVAEDCDCPTDIEINTNNCIAVFELNQTEGNVDYVIYGDEYQESFIDQGTIFTWEAPQNGEYEICAYYESEDCEGVSICDAFVIEGCSEVEPCAMELGYFSGEEGYYLFEASNNQDAPIEWFVNGDYIETGNAFDWTFNNPGTYEVCAAFESENCPEGIISCVNIVVLEDDNCTEVTITIDVEGDLLEDFDLAYELDGLDFPFGGDITIYNNCGSTVITFCVPDGCYEMTMSLEEFLEVALLFELFVDGGVDYEYTIDPLTQTVAIEFGINTDCSTGISENVAQDLEVYPVPSSALINVKHNLSNATWTVYDTQGRMVDQGTTNGSQLMVIDIQSYASGTYVIQMVGDNSTVQQRFQKVD